MHFLEKAMPNHATSQKAMPKSCNLSLPRKSHAQLSSLRKSYAWSCNLPKNQAKSNPGYCDIFHMNHGWYSKVLDWQSPTINISYRSRWIWRKTRNRETGSWWANIPLNQGVPHWGNFSVARKIMRQVEDHATIIKMRIEGLTKQTDDLENYWRTNQKRLKIKD